MRRGLAARLRLQEEPTRAVVGSGSVDCGDAIALIRGQLLADCPGLIDSARSDAGQRQRLADAVGRLIIERNITAGDLTREDLIRLSLSEIVGFGPLEPLLGDPGISEIMVNAADDVWIERDGALEPTQVRFRDDAQVVDIMTRIVAPLGRRIDQSSPCVDGRLPDGSRVHAVIPPIAVRGPALTIRRFIRRAEAMADLVGLGALPDDLAAFLGGAVRSHLNIIISGGTASGKTTTLNCLASCIDAGERVITIEDAAELRLPLRHVVALEARPPSIEGTGEVPIRHLVRNALRMRPDRIIIGECRGAEAFDLLQAMNTGHEGALSTVHANSPDDAIARLANMVLMADEGLPYEAIIRQIVAAVDLVVHQARFADGSRRITAVSAMDKHCSGSTFSLRQLFSSQGADELHHPAASWSDASCTWESLLASLAMLCGRQKGERPS